MYLWRGGEKERAICIYIVVGGNGAADTRSYLL